MHPTETEKAQHTAMKKRVEKLIRDVKENAGEELQAIREAERITAADLSVTVNTRAEDSIFSKTPLTMACWRDGKWHADELANLAAKLELERASIPDPASAVPALVGALEQIADVPAVPFSTDRLEHAARTIEKMQEIARAALALAQGGKR